jgi:hypothetical protein
MDMTKFTALDDVGFRRVSGKLKMWVDDIIPSAAGAGSPSFGGVLVDERPNVAAEGIDNVTRKNGGSQPTSKPPVALSDHQADCIS